jgi:hypothetical protein
MDEKTERGLRRESLAGASDPRPCGHEEPRPLSAYELKYAIERINDVMTSAVHRSTYEIVLTNNLLIALRAIQREFEARYAVKAVHAPWQPLAKALFKVKGPTVGGANWWDYQGEAQLLVAAMDSAKE